MSGTNLTNNTLSERFARLPYEIRALIWLSTIEPRRIVEIDVEPGQEYYENMNKSEPELHLSAEFLRWGFEYVYSPTPIPVALHVCSESRNAVALYYQRAFEIGTAPRYHWVNFDLDIIHTRALCFLQDSGISRIRRLRIPHRKGGDGWGIHSISLRNLPNLIELIIVRRNALED